MFIGTYLDKNIFSDFRYRKISPYNRVEVTITGMKIVSMDTDSIKKKIENKVNYKYLYKVFDKYHEMSLEMGEWHECMITDAAEEYKA